MAKSSTSYQPGRSGNPNGRPKREWTWSGVLQDAVEKSEKDGVPVKVHVAEALVQVAIKGNIQAVNLTNGSKVTKMPKMQKDIFEPTKKTDVMGQTANLYADRPNWLPGLDSNQRP